MNRLQFSLARMTWGVTLTAVVLGAAKFWWDFLGGSFLLTFSVVVVAAYATLILWGRGQTWLVGFSLGAAAGWLLSMFAIDFAGIGHGTYTPSLVFFSPLVVLSAALKSNWMPVFSGGFLLYALYGLATVQATRKQWGLSCFVAILLFHYGCLAVELWVARLDQLAIAEHAQEIGLSHESIEELRKWSFVDSAFRKMFDMMPYRMIASAILFVGTQIGTVVFLIAWRAWPGRFGGRVA